MWVMPGLRVAVQLQLEWKLDMSISDMAQMVPRCNMHEYKHAAVQRIEQTMQP